MPRGEPAPPRPHIGSRESVILLAFDDHGHALGFTQLYPTFCSVQAAPIWVLYDLFVAESGRRQGVGRALMNAARDFAVETEAQRFDLSTATDNVTAQSFYESLGYVRDDEFYHDSLAITG